jgi:hypothetical protein
VKIKGYHSWYLLGDDDPIDLSLVEIVGSKSIEAPNSVLAINNNTIIMTNMCSAKAF